MTRAEDGTDNLHVEVNPEGVDAWYVLRDARNADEWTDELAAEQLGDYGARIRGSAEAIRWLYDWMEWAEDEYRREDGRLKAEACREVADAAWGALLPDPPERQRTRRVR